MATSPSVGVVLAALTLGCALPSCSANPPANRESAEAPGIDQYVNFPFTLRRAMTLNTQRTPVPGAVVAIAWSPDGSRIAASAYVGALLTVWDSAGRQISSFERLGGGPELGHSLAFLNGASELAYYPAASAPSEVGLSIWDVATGKIVGAIGSIERGINPAVNHYTECSVYNNESSIACIGGSTDFYRNLSIYDVGNRKVISHFKIDALLNSISVSPDGRTIAVGTFDGAVVALDPRGSSPARMFRVIDSWEDHDTMIGAVASSPDGSFIFAAAGPIWADETDPSVQRELKTRAAAFVLQTANGKKVASFPGPPIDVIAAAWDPRNRYVAFVDSYAHLILWRPFSSKLSYAKITLPTRSTSLAVSPDGNKIAVGEDTGVEIFSIR